MLSTALVLVDGPIVQWSPWGLLAVVLLLIFSGRLVPWIFYNERGKIIAKQDEQIAVKDEQITELQRQLSILGSEVGANIVAVMRAIQRGPTDDAEDH